MGIDETYRLGPWSKVGIVSVCVSLLTVVVVLIVCHV